MCHVKHYDENELEIAIADKKKKTGRKVLPKPNIPLNTKTIERSYFRVLKHLTDDLKRFTKETLFPQLDGILAEAEYNRPDQPTSLKLDAYIDDLEQIVDNIRIRYGEKYSEIEMRNMANRFADKTQEFNLNEINKNFKKVLGTNAFLAEPYLSQEVAAFTKSNVALIKSIGDNYFNDIEGIVTRAAQSGKLTGDVRKEIQKRFKVTENRAKLIARDQISKFNGSLTKVRQQNVGIGKYRWSTSLDERVRDTHAAKEGRVYSWNEPPADTGHPGEDINCRCVAIPIFDE